MHFRSHDRGRGMPACTFAEVPPEANGDRAVGDHRDGDRPDADGVRVGLIVTDRIEDHVGEQDK